MQEAYIDDVKSLYVRREFKKNTHHTHPREVKGLEIRKLRKTDTHPMTHPSTHPITHSITHSSDEYEICEGE